MMDDEKYRDMVIDHDKHLDSLASSVGVLASTVGKTNEKIEKMIVVINNQNVINEKIQNMEENHNKSIKRIYSNLNVIETHIKDEINPTILKWFLGFIISQAILFGTYTVNNFNIESNRLTKIETKIETLHKD